MTVSRGYCLSLHQPLLGKGPGGPWVHLQEVFADDSEDIITCQTHRESHGLWGQMNCPEHHYSTYFPLASESVWARGD